MGKKVGAVPPFWGELGPHLIQCGYNVAWAEAYLHAKFHLDASNRLATIHQRYRQTEQTTVRQHRANRFTNVRPKTTDLQANSCHTHEIGDMAHKIARNECSQVFMRFHT